MRSATTLVVENLPVALSKPFSLDWGVVFRLHLFSTGPGHEGPLFWGLDQTAEMIDQGVGVALRREEARVSMLDDRWNVAVLGPDDRACPTRPSRST